MWRLIVLVGAMFGMATNAACAMPAWFAARSGSTPPYALAVNLWRQFDTPRPTGGVAASVSRTANTLRSDAGFAGLIMRCNERGEVDLVLVLLDGFVPRTAVNVTLSDEGGPKRYAAKVLGTGLELLLPERDRGSLSSIWRNQKELVVEIEGPRQPIHGTVDLDGAGEAFAQLLTKCSR